MSARHPEVVETRRSLRSSQAPAGVTEERTQRGQRWMPILLIGFLAIVMFVPIRRYALPIPLPFALEPYRLVLGLLAVIVVVGLLTEPHFRWLSTGFGWAFGAFIASILLSIAVNASPLAASGLLLTAVGGAANVITILSLFFLMRQLLRSEADVLRLLTFLVWAGAIVAVFSLVERATHVNVFHQLGSVLPLTTLREADADLRSGGARAWGSSQHPIALSVLLATLIPIALYLARFARWPINPVNRKIVFALVALALLGGVVSAVSRTAIVALAVMFVFVLILRPVLAAVIATVAVPVLLAAWVVLPRLVGDLVLSFLDVDELVASQYTSPGWTGQGRLADLEPALAEVDDHPVFGVGYGSRIVVGSDANSFILDNQALGILMESGIVGIVGFATLLLAPFVLLVRAAFTRTLPAARALLAFAIAASHLGFSTALFFYDAFGFYQSFIVWLALLAAGGWVLTAPVRPPDGAPQ